MPKNYYTVKEVASLLGVSTNTAYKYLDEGRIKSSRMGKAGRFRIPAGELGGLLKEAGAGLPDPEVSIGASFLPDLSARDINSPSLFDWFVAIMAMGIGFAQFIFPTYVIDPGFNKYLAIVRFLKLGLLLAGGTLVLTDILGARRTVLHKIIHFVLAALFVLTGITYLLLGHLPQFVDYISIAAVLLASAFVRYSERIKYLIFINLLIFLTGVSLLFTSTSFKGDILASVFYQNHILFFVLWGIVMVFSLMASFMAVKKDNLLPTFFAFLVSLGGVIYASFAFSNGYWESAIFSTILAAFSLIFPFSTKFEEFTQRSKKEFIGSFIWLLTIFLVGSVVLVFTYKSFEHYLLSEVQNRLSTAVSIIDSFMKGNEDRISVFSQDSGLVSAMENGGKDASSTEKILKGFYFASGGSLRRIVLTNREGINVMTYPYLNEGIGVDISATDYFKGVKDSGGLYLTGIVKPITPGVPPAVLAIMPIYDSGGQFLGALSGSIDLENLAAKINEVKFGENGVFLVADSQKDYIINPREDGILTPVEKASPISLAVDGHEGQMKAYSSTGVLSFMAYKNIQSLGWGISAQQPYTDAFRSYSVSGFVIFLVLIIVGVGSLIQTIRTKKL